MRLCLIQEEVDLLLRLNISVCFEKGQQGLILGKY